MVIVVLALLIACCSCVQGIDSSFDINPFNTTYEGFAAIDIACQVFLFAIEIESIVSVWKDGNILTSNGVFIDEQLQNRATLTYQNDPFAFYPYSFVIVRVNIRPVIRNDTGSYQCFSHAGNPSENPPLYQSEELFLTVRFYPEPICTPSGTARINLGDQAILSCSLQEGDNKAVDIQWTSSTNSTVMTKEDIFRDNGIVTSTLTLITAEINDVFTCEVTNEYVSKNCIIPVNIIWPSLSIKPGEAIVELNDDVEFTCNFRYLTDFVSNWTWDSNPPLASFRIASSVGNTFVLSNVSEDDNGTVISCFALFQNRWFQATAMLYVTSHSAIVTTSIPPASSKQTVDNSSGWKAAFSIFFILFVAAIGGIIFRFLKFRNVAKSSVDNSLRVTHSPPHSPTANSPGIPDTSVNQQGAIEDTYTELQRPTETDKEDMKQLVKTTKEPKNEYVYEIEDAEEEHVNVDDSIYDYAETEDNQQPVYTNQNIRPRKT